ncbi:MAG: hypothetical protein HYS12_15585 [Planctomycetes bacterium]|nr:hypothetical protein [Planctomycetota bacterium]
MLLLGGGGAAWGLTAGFLLARRLGRSFIQLRVPIHDAAGKLNEVVGPVEVDAGQSLEQLEMALQKLADQVSAVVARLQESQREALRAEQMACVGQLAAGIAHELRNPLTAVKMLLEGNREEAAARGMPLEDFDVIEQEVGRLERRLQQFLDFARPPRLERRPVELGNLVRQTLGLVCGRARQQNVQLEVTALCPPIVAEADAEQLRQVFVNLALNALDAMPRGGVLEFLLSPPANGYAEVVVQDTGPGIAPALLPRLFEPFVSGKETGLGLGLVVSRRIVESHGGSLTAANQPQGGARFVLRLPLGKSEKENPKPEVRNPKSEIRNPKQERASLPSDFGFSSFGFS